MVFAYYIIKINQGTHSQVHELMALVAARTQVRQGCLKSSLWRSDDSSELMLLEVWRSMQDLERHIGSSLYRKLLYALEMSAGEPTVWFSECGLTNGIEMVQSVISDINSKDLKKPNGKLDNSAWFHNSFRPVTRA